MIEAQPFGISPVVGATVGNLASFTAVGLGDSGVSSLVAHDPATLYVAANGNDATAARGRSDLPFATLNAAAEAAVSGDSIRVGVGTFAPLTAALPAWVRIVGSGRPHVDSVTAPTMLTGGTVIQGPLLPDADGFELWNAGVDSGSAICTAMHGGAALDGLGLSNVVPNCALAGSPTGGTFTLTGTSYASGSTVTTAAIAYNAIDSALASAIELVVGAGAVTVTGTAGNWLIQPDNAAPYTFTVNTGLLTGGTLTAITRHPTGLPQLKGVKVVNVACLGQSATAPIHACRIENVVGAEIGRLETWFGTYGVALKGVDINFQGCLSTGHATAALVVKSDDYAPTDRVNVVNLAMRSLTGGTGGLLLESADAALAYVNVENLTFDGGISTPITITNAVSMDNIHLGNNCGGVVPVGISGTITNFTFFCAVQSPSLLNSWTNYGSGNSLAGYWMEGNTVHLRGTLTGGSSGTILFDLPAGFMPPNNCRGAAITASGGISANAADIAITATGQVYMEANYAGSWVAIDGVSFSVQ